MEKEVLKVVMKAWKEYKNQDGVYSDEYSFVDFMEFLSSLVKE